MARVQVVPFSALLIVLVAAPASCQLTPSIGFAPPGTKPSAAIPATPPTASTPASVATSPAPSGQKQSRRPEVTFTAGQLYVKAENSSLNQILREIGRTTGLKITGGVAEERVYGRYGPGTTSDVLSALLDGTASNMLLVAGGDATAGELVLTPRHGGPTPPNPNAPSFEDEDGPQETQAPAFVPQGRRGAIPGLAMPEGTNPGSSPGSNPGSNLGTPQNSNVPPLATSPESVPPTATSTAPPTATSTGTNPTDPNAVKTPQQIYEQLQRLRQQVQQPTPQ